MTHFNFNLLHVLLTVVPLLATAAVSSPATVGGTLSSKLAPVNGTYYFDLGSLLAGTKGNTTSRINLGHSIKPRCTVMNGAQFKACEST
jgi:hypothetical protein